MGAITLADVALGPASQPVLTGVDLAVETGERLGLLGASGSGKTRLLRAIAGLETPLRGRVEVNSSPPVPSRSQVTMVFQEDTVYDHLDVAGNLSFPLPTGGGRAESRVVETARRFALEGVLDRRPASLSAGERRLVAAARALVRPGVSVVLLDEPLTGTDPQLRHRVMQAVAGDDHLTLVFATREPSDVFRWAGRVAVLSGGRVAQVGEPLDVYRRPVSVEVAELTGELNRIPAVAVPSGLEMGASRIGLPGGLHVPPGTPVVAGVRPRHLRVVPDGAAFERRLRVTVGRVEPMGGRQRILFGLGRQRGVGFAAEFESTRRLSPGDTLDLAVDPAQVLVFDPATGRALG